VNKSKTPGLQLNFMGGGGDAHALIPERVTLRFLEYQVLILPVFQL
jgi:hypothetical protein